MKKAYRRGAVLSIETLLQLGVVAIVMGVIFGVFNIIRSAGTRFEQELQKAPWRDD